MTKLSDLRVAGGVIFERLVRLDSQAADDTFYSREGALKHVACAPKRGELAKVAYIQLYITMALRETG